MVYDSRQQYLRMLFLQLWKSNNPSHVTHPENLRWFYFLLISYVTKRSQRCHQRFLSWTVQSAKWPMRPFRHLGTDREASNAQCYRGAYWPRHPILGNHLWQHIQEISTKNKNYLRFIHQAHQRKGKQLDMSSYVLTSCLADSSWKSARVQCVGADHDRKGVTVAQLGIGTYIIQESCPRASS